MEIHCVTCFKYPLSEEDVEILEEMRGFGVDEFTNANYCWECALKIFWEQMERLRGKNEWREYDAGFDTILNMVSCDCVKKEIVGRNWWENLGYENRCSCAWRDLRNIKFCREIEQIKNE